MVSYLGFPLNFPNGEPFGTICILDRKENKYSEEHEQLLQQFKSVVELDWPSFNRWILQKRFRQVNWLNTC